MTLEEYRRQKAIQANPELAKNTIDGVEQDTNFWNNLGAGSYNALNEVLMGLPDFLVKNIGGEGGSKALEDLRKYHKTASDVGSGLGLAGSLFIPGGALLKGAGLAAKGLGAAKLGEKALKGAEFLRGTELTGNLGQKVLQGAKRGIGQGIEQGVARGITGLDVNDPNSPQNSLENLATSAVTGGVAGGVLGPLAQKLLGRTKLTNKITGEAEDFGKTGAQHAIEETQEVLDKGTLGSVGIETRALRKAAQQLGLNKIVAGGRNADTYVAELAKAVRDTGITGKKGWEALLDKTDSQWDEIEKGFARHNPTPESWKPRIQEQVFGKTPEGMYKDPDIQAFVDSASDSRIAQQAIDDINSVIGSKNNIGDARTKLSSIIRDNIKSQDPDKLLKARSAIFLKNKIDDFIADNSLVSPALIQDAKKNYKLLQPFLAQESREATALNKLFDAGPGTMEKLAATSLTAGAGGATGVALGGGIDENDPTKAISNFLLGSLAGGAAKKFIPKIANKGLDVLARGAGSALEKEGVRKAIETGINAAKQIPRLPAIAAASKDQTEEIPQLETQPPEIPQGQEVSTAPDLSPKLKSILQSKLGYIYENEYADQYTPEEFMSKVANKTKNFTDKGSLATFLFDDPKERDAYLRQIQAYEDMKNIDIDKALKGRGGISLGSLGTIGGDEEAGNAYDKLVNTILNLKNEGDITKRTPAQEKNIANTIALLRKNPEMLQSFLTGTGLDFKTLEDMGVI